MRPVALVILTCGVLALAIPLLGQSTQPDTQPATQPDTQPSTEPAKPDQDGPGLYRISAGPGGRYTTTVRAKSREDAIDKGMATVVQQAMDGDENVEIHELKVEKIGP